MKMSIRTKTLFLSVITGAVVGGSSPVCLGADAFVEPPFRSLEGSRTAGWESFTVAVGEPGNAPDQAGSTAEVRLLQSDQGAIVTGSGNLYNPGGLSQFTLVENPTAGVPTGTVVLQIRTLGSEVDPASARLTCTNDTGVRVLAPLATVELDRVAIPGLGSSVTTLWQWNVTGLATAGYEVNFTAAETSLSLDAVRFDTAAEFAPLFTPPFAITDTTPDLERWMYPHNAAPCDRQAGSTFATFGDGAGVDTRHAQHLIGWDTTALLPAHHGASDYLVTRCRVTLTLNRGDLFVFDPTHDAYTSYLDPGVPAATDDEDAGRPVELFGVGYRNGFDAGTFEACTPFGGNEPAMRNAFALSWTTTGEWVDISNNVGKSDPAFPAFEAVPFAVGTTTETQPGDLVPPGAQMTFELNLADPFVLAYVQQGLDAGRLRFAVSSLHTSSGQTGPASYPDFATRFNLAVVDPTQLEIEGRIVGEGDLDADGLPDDWELARLGALSWDAIGDPDEDGGANAQELGAGTAPLDGNDRLAVDCERLPDGGLRLRWQNQAQREYVIEVTEDWRTWTALPESGRSYPVVGVVEQGVPAPEGSSAAAGFYRVRAEIR